MEAIGEGKRKYDDSVVNGESGISNRREINQDVLNAPCLTEGIKFERYHYQTE